jgi:hypothetical protein
VILDVSHELGREGSLMPAPDDKQAPREIVTRSRSGVKEAAL